MEKDKRFTKEWKSAGGTVRKKEGFFEVKVGVYVLMMKLGQQDRRRENTLSEKQSWSLREKAYWIMSKINEGTFLVIWSLGKLWLG